MLSNGEECYILRENLTNEGEEKKSYFSQEGNSFVQKFIKSQEFKHIGEIVRVKDDFMVVSHTKYDVNVDLNLLIDSKCNCKSIEFPRII